MSKLSSSLSIVNHHERDNDIKFIEEGHKYIIKEEENVKYTSVTTVVHGCFEQFDSEKIINKMMKGYNWKEGHKYWGKTKEQIKKEWQQNGDIVSSAGTLMHYKIECFMNMKGMDSDYNHNDLICKYEKEKEIDTLRELEWEYFIKFVKENPEMKPYRTEWTVYNEEKKLAGSIDMVYINEDGTLSIYDWKRCKEITNISRFNKTSIKPLLSHIPDTNFWHYSLQLNIYRRILEEKYNKRVRDMYLIRLHPTASEKTYEQIKVPSMDEEITDLMNEL